MRQREYFGDPELRFRGDEGERVADGQMRAGPPGPGRGLPPRPPPGRWRACSTKSGSPVHRGGTPTSTAPTRRDRRSAPPSPLLTSKVPSSLGPAAGGLPSERLRRAGELGLAEPRPRRASLRSCPTARRWVPKPPHDRAAGPLVHRAAARDRVFFGPRAAWKMAIMTDGAMLARASSGAGFIAALDQSGGSTPGRAAPFRHPGQAPTTARGRDVRADAQDASHAS